MMPALSPEGIVVLGAPRSGTTLLRRLLDAHPNIACPGETHILNACARFLHTDSLAEGIEMGVLSGLSFAGFPDDQVLEKLRTFAFGFPRAYAERQGKGRWAEKTAIDVFYLDEIERLCGDRVHFVCVIRHGLDVACSNKELADQNGAYLDEMHRYIQRDKRPLEALCHAWVDVTEALTAFAVRHPDTAFVFRYEDLVAKPDSTLRDILHFVGEAWDPTLLSRALTPTDNLGLGDWKTYRTSEVGRSSVGRWKSLSPALVSSLGEIVNPTLGANGYEPVPVIEDRSDDEARRRYELGLLVQAARKDINPGA